MWRTTTTASMFLMEKEWKLLWTPRVGPTAPPQTPRMPSAPPSLPPPLPPRRSSGHPSPSRRRRATPRTRCRTWSAACRPSPGCRTRVWTRVSSASPDPKTAASSTGGPDTSCPATSAPGSWRGGTSCAPSAGCPSSPSSSPTWAENDLQLTFTCLPPQD